MGFCKTELALKITTALPKDDNTQRHTRATRHSPLLHERMGYRKMGHFHRCGNKSGEWLDMIWMEKLI